MGAENTMRMHSLLRLSPGKEVADSACCLLLIPRTAVHGLETPTVPTLGSICFDACWHGTAQAFVQC